MVDFIGVRWKAGDALPSSRDLVLDILALSCVLFVVACIYVSGLEMVPPSVLVSLYSSDQWHTFVLVIPWSFWPRPERA